jgi:uncharacterized membrane protein YphA (DoxX/SURF4 family)
MASMTSTHRALLGPAADVADVSPASHRLPLGQILLAAAMMALGVRGLIVGDFASVWQRIPIEHLPARSFFVYASALIELATGVGLLMKRIVAISSAVLLIFLLLWAVLLKLPAVLFVPQMEATWLGFGEIAVIAAGGWVVFASNAGAWSRDHLRFATGTRGVGWARLLFAIALPMIGLSHFVYAKITVGFIPTWIPAPYLWAYLTGGASIAASLAVLFGIMPKLASTLEAAMLSVITLLVWLPGAITAPGNDSITPFLMSAAIACGAWAVADSYRNMTSVRQPSKAILD